MNPSVVLALALVGISFGGPLVRLSTAQPLVIALGRIGFSLIVVAGALLVTGSWRQWRALDRRSLGLALAAGVMLAVHFWSWNASIGLTTVAASVVLVNMQPVIVAALSVTLLHEPPSRLQWLGIAIGMIGATVVASPAFGFFGSSTPAIAYVHNRALLGDLLALVGAATGACYYVAGRRLRATLDIWPYVGLVYGAAFAALLLFAAAARVAVVPQPPRELAIFAGLALGPMLLGHTGFNWALRFMPAYVVNLTLLGEPVGATLLAAVLPGIREMPGIATLIGGALIFIGIYMAVRALPADVAAADSTETTTATAAPSGRGTGHR
ncbi:MAG TPA: DMT family transporter [Gemmatimonadaceae bacterium]|jgi:drug/metabolite transporter (DMT)-like permease|nr:DMT family transporter [Gemmatimonadaceae bacterium]